VCVCVCVFVCVCVRVCVCAHANPPLTKNQHETLHHELPVFKAKQHMLQSHVLTNGERAVDKPSPEA